MRKRGFTVIETIVSLCIILIVFSCAAASIKVEKNIYGDIESKGFLYEVHDLLTYAKLKSKVEGKRTKILVNPDENTIYFIDNNSSTIKSLSGTKNIRITSSKEIFQINNLGRINKAEKIEFQNCFNEVKQARIRVGVDYINLVEN